MSRSSFGTSNWAPYFLANASHSATNFLMPTWSIRLIAPPVCGAKPRPMIEPTSPSCGLVSTLLSRQRAVSTACT